MTQNSSSSPHFTELKSNVLPLKYVLMFTSVTTVFDLSSKQTSHTFMWTEVMFVVSICSCCTSLSGRWVAAACRLPSSLLRN